MTETILAIIRDQIRYRDRVPDIAPDSPLRGERGLSLQGDEIAAIAMAVEDEFDVRFSDEAVQAWASPGCIVAGVAKFGRVG
jgi:acyl carrier protein